MSSLDILHYSLAAGFLIIAGFLGLAAYRLSQALKAIKILVEDVEDTAKELKVIKDSFKMGISSLLNLFIRKMAKKETGKKSNGKGSKSGRS